MTAAHVRRGGAARARAGKPSKVAVPKKIAKRLPVDQARANKVAALIFGAFVLAIGVVVLIALDIPAKAERAAGTAIGEAGFKVSGYQIVGLNHMNRALVDAVVADELRRAAADAGADKAPQALVDVSEIRRRLLGYGWVKDARVSRRLPDSLVIDIVERRPAALWQNQGELALIDDHGVVLDRVPVDKMPDLMLLIGPDANGEEQQLSRLLDSVPSLKPQLASATWVGSRRWDLSFQSGETVLLPEGEAQATEALSHFARHDRSEGLLGRGILQFDLRNWPRTHQMTVRLPRSPGEPIAPPSAPPPREG
jgi:cell division protein FtsQ